MTNLSENISAQPNCDIEELPPSQITSEFCGLYLLRERCVWTLQLCSYETVLTRANISRLAARAASSSAVESAEESVKVMACCWSSTIRR